MSAGSTNCRLTGSTAMQIRREQITTFERAALQNTESELLEHLQEAFPKHCALLGEKERLESVRYALTQSRAYGFTSKEASSLYLDLMFLLGRYFDVDPQLPWAPPILSDVSQPEVRRIARLYDAAMDYLVCVSGPENEFIDEAQRRVRQESIDRPIEPSVFAYAQARMAEIFPEKAMALEAGGLASLVANAARVAAVYGLTTDRGVLVYAGLMFLLGSGFDRDPLFGWAKEVLRDPGVKNPEERATKLHAAAMTYLDQWCG